jgi:hypothetical protein
MRDEYRLFNRRQLEEVPSAPNPAWQAARVTMRHDQQASYRAFSHSMRNSTLRYDGRRKPRRSPDRTQLADQALERIIRSGSGDELLHAVGNRASSRQCRISRAPIKISEPINPSAQ